MQIRKIFFWLHLVVGFVAGAIILLMSVTGVLLAFERQIMDWADSDLRSQRASGEVERLSLAEIIGKARETRPGETPTAIALRSDATAPAKVSFGRDRSIHVDVYSGANLGEGSTKLREFFKTVTALHRWLALKDEQRATGKSITGASNLAFLFLVISGVILWFPRSWSAKAVKAILIPSLRLRGKARDFNWHNAIGIWTAPALVVIVATGVLISYPWATNLLYRATGNEPPAAKPNAERPAGGPRENGRASTATPDWSGLDRAWPVAAKQFADWRTISVQLPSSATAPVTFAIERSHRGRPDLKAQLTIDPTTSEIVKTEDFASYNSGRRLRTWGRWLHTGEAGGLGGQIVAALATMGAIVLVVTGIALGFRRFFKRSGNGKPELNVPQENKPASAESALSEFR